MSRNMETLMQEQARLIILKELQKQINETLNSDLLFNEVRRFGIRKPREWVHGELAWLQEMGAVTTMEVGSIMVATLTEKGHRHLDREIAIEGIQRPSRPGG